MRPLTSLFALLLLLASAGALAAERGFFGFGLSLAGTGFMLNPTITRLGIAKVMPDTPAARAGIRAGDEIVKVEGVAVAGRKAKTVQASAARNVGQTLHLELKRPGGEVYAVALVAAKRPD